MSIVSFFSMSSLVDNGAWQAVCPSMKATEKLNSAMAQPSIPSEKEGAMSALHRFIAH